MEFDELSHSVIGCAIEVHRGLGPGVLESVYEHCLAFELKNEGIECCTQVAMPVRYKGIEIDCGFRIDLLVPNKLIIELKAVKALLPVHEAQLLTYMKLSGVSVGLLMNFNTPKLRDGIKRFVL